MCALDDFQLATFIGYYNNHSTDAELDLVFESVSSATMNCLLRDKYTEAVTFAKIIVDNAINRNKREELEIGYKFFGDIHYQKHHWMYALLAYRKLIQFGSDDAEILARIIEIEARLRTSQAGISWVNISLLVAVNIAPVDFGTKLWA